MSHSFQRRLPEVLAARSPLTSANSTGVSSARFINALLVGGFEVFRVDAQGTILERDGRAVVVPHGARLDRAVVDELRKIAGVSWLELSEHLARDPSIF